MIAVALVSFALAQTGSHPAFEDVKEVVRSLDAWQFDDARRRATRLFREHPHDPLALAALADAKLHHGDYSGAVALYREARAEGVPEVLLQNASLAEAAMSATDGYVEEVGEAVVVRYPPGRDEILAPFVFETVDAALKSHSSRLGFEPEERVLVELYPSAKTLAKVSSLTEQDIENSGTIALCKWNRLMVTTPRAVAFGYAWRDTISHELAHLIIGGASRNRAPIWLHEGLAKYIETAWRGEPGEGISIDQQRRLRAAAKAGTLIPFERMHPSMAKLPTQEQTSLAFAEVFTFIEFLVARKGWAGIRQVLREIADGASDISAIEAAYGASFGSLEQAWKKSLPSRPIKAPSDGRAVKAARPIELRAQADAPEDELHGLSDEARRHARAADLLYTRGRIEAALIELRRAQRAEPSHQLASKIAFLALQTGDLEGAEEAAREAAAQGDYAGPNVILAQVLVQQGKVEEARLPLQRAIDVNPFDPRIHELLATIEAADGNAEAAADARRALALMSQPTRTRLPSLGEGALVEFQGAPFHRVHIAKLIDGEPDRWLPTRVSTPTPALPVRPGRYRLRLYPPRGGVIERDVTVSEGVQTVNAEPSGS